MLFVRDTVTEIVGVGVKGKDVGIPDRVIDIVPDFVFGFDVGIPEGVNVKLIVRDTVNDSV